MTITELSINRRITIYMVSLIIFIFRIVSCPCLGLKMVGYYAYCSNVSQGKRKNMVKMNGRPPSWKVKDYQEDRKTGQASFRWFATLR